MILLFSLFLFFFFFSSNSLVFCCLVLALLFSHFLSHGPLCSSSFHSVSTYLSVSVMCHFLSFFLAEFCTALLVPSSRLSVRCCIHLDLLSTHGEKVKRSGHCTQKEKQEEEDREERLQWILASPTLLVNHTTRESNVLLLSLTLFCYHILLLLSFLFLCLCVYFVPPLLLILLCPCECASLCSMASLLHMGEIHLLLDLHVNKCRWKLLLQHLSFYLSYVEPFVL